MKPRIKIAAATLPDGSVMDLIQHDQDFVLSVNREVLMSTRVKLSEEVLAQIGLDHESDGQNILIGGLGLGYTLQEALKICSPEAVILQAELVPEIVEWNRGPLGAKNDHAIDDPRVQIEMGDVTEVIRQYQDHFDAIILDVDNGPSPMVSPTNAVLYEIDGLYAAYQALRPKGRLTVWSADDDKGFKNRMRDAGFLVSTKRVRGSRGRGNPTHVIFIGDKSR